MPTRPQSQGEVRMAADPAMAPMAPSARWRNRTARKPKAMAAGPSSSGARKRAAAPSRTALVLRIGGFQMSRRGGAKAKLGRGSGSARPSWAGVSGIGWFCGRGTRSAKARSARRKDHDHLAAFEARELLDLGGAVELGSHAFQDLHPQLLMHHLAAAEAHGHLDLVAFLEEAGDRSHLHVVVVLVDTGAQLDLLDVDDLLPLARYVLLLLLLILELPGVEDLADRGIGVGRNLDEVEAGIGGHVECLA